MSGLCFALLGSSRARASPVPWWHWRCWQINLQSLFNKDHYIIFNLTVNVFCNADTSRHICLDGLKPQTKPCVGGLATTKWFNSALILISGQRGKVILWPKATNILHFMSFTFLSSLEIFSYGLNIRELWRKTFIKWQQILYLHILCERVPYGSQSFPSFEVSTRGC